MMEVVVTTGAIRRAKLQSNHITTNKPTLKLLQAGCPSRRPTNQPCIHVTDKLTLTRVFATYTVHARFPCQCSDTVAQQTVSKH